MDGVMIMVHKYYDAMMEHMGPWYVVLITMEWYDDGGGVQSTAMWRQTWQYNMQKGREQVVQIEHRSRLPEDMALTRLDFHNVMNQVVFGNVRAP